MGKLVLRALECPILQKQTRRSVFDWLNGDMKFTINNWYQKRQIRTFHFPLKRYSEEVELFQKEEHDETEGARPRNDGHQTRDLPNKRLWNVKI